MFSGDWLFKCCAQPASRTLLNGNLNNSIFIDVCCFAVFVDITNSQLIVLNVVNVCVTV
jgi:hypothetical protein